MCIYHSVWHSDLLAFGTARKRGSQEPQAVGYVDLKTGTSHVLMEFESTTECHVKAMLVAKGQLLLLVQSAKPGAKWTSTLVGCDL